MDGFVVGVAVHELEAESAVGAGVADLVTDLRANKRGCWCAPRVETDSLNLAHVATDEVALEGNDIAFDDGETNLELLPVGQGHDFVLGAVFDGRTSGRLAAFERN